MRGISLLLTLSLVSSTLIGAQGNPPRLSSTDNDTCLWLSFGQCVKEKDGRAVMPLEIKFGTFPDAPRDMSELKDLRAYGALAGRAPEKEPVFFELPVETVGGKLIVKVTSSSSSRHIVEVEAASRDTGSVKKYSASTAFTLFGRSLPVGSKPQCESPSPVALERRMEVSLEPRFDYWPQVGSPLSIRCSLDKKPLAMTRIRIHDENLPATGLVTSQTGTCAYTPPEDRKLSWLGETAFKQMVIVARHDEEAMESVASHTRILHRSRTTNLRLSHGMMVFGCSAAAILALVIMRRMKENHET